MLIRNGSLFEADEQGLGKTLQTVGLIWLDKLMVYMDESIQYWRQSGSNPDSDEKKSVHLHEHLQADAPKGSKCPSAKHWPIQCRCQPCQLGDSSARDRHTQRRLDNAHLMVRRGQGFGVSSPSSSNESAK